MPQINNNRLNSETSLDLVMVNFSSFCDNFIDEFIIAQDIFI